MLNSLIDDQFVVSPAEQRARAKARRERFFPAGNGASLLPLNTPRKAMVPSLVQSMAPPIEEEPEPTPEAPPEIVIPPPALTYIPMAEPVSMTVEEIHEVMGSTVPFIVLYRVPEPQRRRRLVAEIIQETATEFRLTPAELKGIRRTRTLARPRQLAMWRVALARPDISLPRIGSYFGGRDHTTVLHAIRNVDRRMREELSYAELIEQIMFWAGVEMTDAARIADRGISSHRATAGRDQPKGA